MTATRLFRDAFPSFTPWWLRARRVLGKTTGYRFLWSMIAPLDALMEGAFQGAAAGFPGIGTSTALPYIGGTRGILRGYGTSETDAHYCGRLINWPATWRQAGMSLAIAKQFHEYLSNRPKVTVVSRAGVWVTVNADGSVAPIVTGVTFDWDSVSNPERATFWSELFVIVYPDPWAASPVLGSGSALGVDRGIGHENTREEADAVRNLIADFKAARDRIRAVIFTTDPTLFDPTTPSSLPDGQWGQWGTRGPLSRVKSHRNVTTCKIWEPN